MIYINLRLQCGNAYFSFTYVRWCQSSWIYDEDTKGVIRIRISKKTTQWPNEKGQKDKQ